MSTELQNKWQQERAEAKAKLQSFASGVAAHLPGWEVTDDPNRDYDHLVQLTNEDGVTFVIIKHSNAIKAEVLGDFPNHPYVGQPRDRLAIGVSLDRDPKAAAGDIARRFIPKFLEQYEVHQQAIASADAHKDITAATAAVIAEAIGKPVPEVDPKSNRARIDYYNGANGGSYGDFEVSSSGRVDVKLHSVTAEQAVAIAAIVRGEFK